MTPQEKQTNEQIKEKKTSKYHRELPKSFKNKLRKTKHISQVT